MTQSIETTEAEALDCAVPFARIGCYECAWGKVAGCWRCGSRVSLRAVPAPLPQPPKEQ